MYIGKNIHILTEPSFEPVSAADYRAYVRMTSAEDDNLITKILTSSRRQCERYTSRPIANTTFIQSQNLMDNYSVSDGLSYIKKSGDCYIGLQKKRLVSVNSVKLFNYNNEEIVVSADDYRVDTLSNKVVFDFGYSMPVLRDISGIQVEYIAGMGANASLIPQDMKDAIMILAQMNYQFNSRADQGIAQMPQAVKEILDYYRDFNLAG